MRIVFIGRHGEDLSDVTADRRAKIAMSKFDNGLDADSYSDQRFRTHSAGDPTLRSHDEHRHALARGRCSERVGGPMACVMWVRSIPLLALCVVTGVGEVVCT